MAHLIYFLSGSAVLGIVAHALATFPTPKNAYGQWVLGVLKYTVGQRISAMNSFNGMQSEVTAVTDVQKQKLADGYSMRVMKTPEGVLKPTETA